MNRQNPHERFAELAAGYALSALEPEDEQLFLAHLPGCASCGRDLTEHRGTLAHLAYAPEVVGPPASPCANRFVFNSTWKPLQIPMISLPASRNAESVSDK